MMPDPGMPPIGIMPRDSWYVKANESRINDLLATIRRYAEAGFPGRVEWVDELDLRLRRKIAENEVE